MKDNRSYEPYHLSVALPLPVPSGQPGVDVALLATIVAKHYNINKGRPMGSGTAEATDPLDLIT